MNHDEKRQPVHIKWSQSLPLDQQAMPTAKDDMQLFLPLATHKKPLKWNKPIAPPPAPAPVETYTSLRLKKLFKPLSVIPQLSNACKSNFARLNASDRFTEHDFTMLALMARLMQKDF